MSDPYLATQGSDGRVTVLLPVYNEAESIGKVLSEFEARVVRPTQGELLVCEDGSTDGSRQVLEELSHEVPMRLVTSPDRKGYAGAAHDGLVQVSTPWVFFADSDGQYDPEDFWKIWEARGSYDMVIGRKVHREERFYRILLSKGFHLLAKAVTTIPLQDMDCGFRLIRREVVDKILPDVYSLQYSFWAEFSIVSYRKGLRIAEIPVSHRQSLRGGTSIYSWNKIPKILILQVVGLLRLARRLNREARAGVAARSAVAAQS
jgi:glycosyltransferase involved in cell wall biosynthesis